MFQINCVKKYKERQLFKLDSFREFKYIDFSKIIPKDAKNIEIYYNDKQGILKVDYLTKLEVKGERSDEYG